MQKSYDILLPSFLRRVLKADVIKAEIRTIGATLQRKGRSRHWILTASFEQIEQIIGFIHTSEEASWQWLVKHINSYKKVLTHDELIQIAKKQSNITINQLMEKTDCTIIEARIVIDELEDLN